MGTYNLDTLQFKYKLVIFKHNLMLSMFFKNKIINLHVKYLNILDSNNLEQCVSVLYCKNPYENVIKMRS